MAHDAAYDAGESEPLAAVYSLLLNLETLEGFLQGIAELAGASLTPPVSCGITVRYDHQPFTVASSDALASALDESQYRVDEGTCLHAMRSGEVVDVADAETDTRWPGYLAAARAQGLRSSLSLPLMVDQEPQGAMNLYSVARPRAFDDQARATAQVFAAQASTALTLARRQEQGTETRHQLEEALVSRSVIDQAMGIIMAQQRCSADQAFGVLRNHSQNHNRKLRVVAQGIVDQVSGGREA